MIFEQRGAPQLVSARGFLADRLWPLVGHLRLCLILGAAVMLVSGWTEAFRFMADEKLAGNGLGIAFTEHWRVHLAVGAGAFGLLALPALWPLWGHWRLERRLRDRRLVPRALAGPLLHWSTALALSCVTATAATLSLSFYQYCESMSYCECESLVLPLAYQAADGLPPKPRIIVNVLPDGTVRINGASYSESPQMVMSWGWKEDGDRLFLAGRIENQAECVHPLEDMARLLAAEAQRHPGAGGGSALAVYVRADANVPFRHVWRIMDACRRAGAYRLSFGVSPQDATRTAAPRAE